MKRPFEQLLGRNKKRLEEKLILYDGSIWKYRNNQLIFVKENDNKTVYHFKLANKKTNKFYPITPAKLKTIRKTKTSESSSQDKFFEWIDAIKKHPHLSKIRNGISWSEEEQKLLLNQTKNSKAFKIMVDNPNYLQNYYESLDKFRDAIIEEFNTLYRNHDVKKMFVDTKTFLIYNREGDSLGVTTVKDIRRGQEGFERILLNTQDIERYVDDYLQMCETYFIDSDYVTKAKDNSSIYQFDNVLKTEFTCVKLLSKYGGKITFELPSYLKMTISNIDIPESDINKCFFWSIIYALNKRYKAFTIADRDHCIRKYKRFYKNDVKYFNNHSLYDIDKKIGLYPVELDNFNLFKDLEQYLNINLQIIFCDITLDKFDSCSIYYNGSKPESDTIQIMYIPNPSDNDSGHFVPIINESNLKNLLNNGRRYVCPTCKQSYISKSCYQNHIKTCAENVNKKYILQPCQTFIRYKDFNKEMKCLVYGACDYETSFKRSELYNTDQTGQHAQLLPLMLKCYIHSDLKNLPSFNSPIYTADDPDFELKFLDDLYDFQEKYLEEIQLNIAAHVDENTIAKHRKATKCFICGHIFGENKECVFDEFECDEEYVPNIASVKLLDHRFNKIQKNKFDVKCYHHNHQTGAYIGALCSRCNLQVSYKYSKIPIFFHNYSGFDSIFLRQAINRWNSKRALMKQKTQPYKPLAISLESDLYGTWGLFSFQDSYKLMSESLDNLVSNLRNSCPSDEHKYIFKTTYEYAQNFDNADNALSVMTHKQYFPYSLIDSMFTLKYDKSTNSLRGVPCRNICRDYLSETMFTQSQYNDMLTTARILKLNSLLDIYKNYLELDVRLLIDVLHNFSETMIKNYSINGLIANDPLWFYTISSYCRSMNTKYTEAVRNSIISVDFGSNKLCWGENKISAAKHCIERFKHSQGIRLLEHNEDELYHFINSAIVGGISYSLNHYAKKSDEVNIRGYDCSSMYSRCLCEWLPFDLRFTKKFDTVDKVNKHLDECNEYDYLQYMFEVDVHIPEELYDKFKQMPPIPNKEITLSGVQKLNLTLRDKSKVIIHQNTLKLYKELGCVITNVYRVVEFVCSPIYYPFIHKSLELRAHARSTFENNLFKLCCNSTFGSTIMNSANYSTIKYLTNAKQIDNLFNKVYKINNVELCEVDGSLRVSLSQKKLCSTPRFIGCVCLQYSKKLLYDFWYNYIVNTFNNPKLHFIETDSIYFSHNGKIRDDLDKQYIGRSAGKFKLEHDDINELVTLRSKMYSYKIGDVETKRAKGISKNYVDKSLHFEDFMQILESSDDITTYASFNQITKNNSEIYITRQTKKLFSKEDNLVDDKTIFVDKYTSVPLGYKHI